MLVGYVRVSTVEQSEERQIIELREKSGVDFSNYENSLTIDLIKNFYGINQVTVDSGLNTLISSSANETLTGNGTTEFIFNKDSRRDVLTNFDFDEDKINVGTNAVTNVRINSAGGVRMEIGGSAVLTLNDAQGKNFKINNFVAIADENLTYSPFDAKKIAPTLCRGFFCPIYDSVRFS